ncbi:MAG: ParB/RepB/Spo0J family partition protein [Phycisphaerae bacterium]|nr:ParB/RepB/Spo0J family partition protein [Phycisphaerae bacterium]
MASKPKKKRRLGKGLESLLAKAVDIVPPPESTTTSTAKSVSGKPNGASQKRVDHQPLPSREFGVDMGNELVYLRTEQIIPNPRQPRQVFDDEGLSALADSLKSAGLMQPIIVRASETPEIFELVAGERRWRAAQLAGLTQLPSIVRDIDDETSAQWALIENLQREDLNPIDRAEAFDRLVVDFNATQKEIALKLGINRSSVANFLRLNDLGDFAKDAVRDGRLSMGHAKVILGIPDLETSKAISRRCSQEQWSVRELERQLKKRTTKISMQKTERDPHEMFMSNLGSQLEEHLGTQVSITLGKKKGSGKLSISFYSNEHFEGILNTFNFKPKS